MNMGQNTVWGTGKSEKQGEEEEEKREGQECVSKHVETLERIHACPNAVMPHARNKT